MNCDKNTQRIATFVALLLGCAIACANEPTIPSVPPTSAASPTSPTVAAVLPEGINDQFLSEDLDVDKFVERFEGESREVFAGRHAIVDALGLSSASQVADVGAGTGFFSVLFAEEIGEQGNVYAVEISPNFLDHLRKLASREDLASLHVVEGTQTSVELESASVDLAFLCDVYHHFESPPATLASLHEAIRPGGSLILIDFERIPGKSPEWLLSHVRAGKEVFREEIEKAGFELEEDIQLDVLENNYMLRFKRLDTAILN